MAHDLRNGESEHVPAETLWSDADKTQQFLIPDTLQLPPGDFRLRTATGREQRVDPAALAAFEVSSEEAQAWAEAQLREVTRRLKAGLKKVLLGTSERVQGQDGKSGGTEATRQASPTPGLDLLAELTGTPRERLSGDYRAIGQALRGYLKDITETAGDALSDDPFRERDAHRRMRDWAETLRTHGIPTAEVEDPDAASGNQKGESVMSVARLQARTGEMIEIQFSAGFLSTPGSGGAWSLRTRDIRVSVDVPREGPFPNRILVTLYAHPDPGARREELRFVLEPEGKRFYNGQLDRTVFIRTGSSGQVYPENQEIEFVLSGSSSEEPLIDPINQTTRFQLDLFQASGLAEENFSRWPQWSSIA